MTLRGLAALGVLVVAGCKQPIINVYPAVCATPAAHSGSLEEYSFNVPVVTAYGPMPTPVATPTPWDGSPREANGGEEWVSNGWGHWEKDDNGENRPSLATPTPTHGSMVAGCPAWLTVNGKDLCIDTDYTTADVCMYQTLESGDYYSAGVPRGKQ